MSVKEAGAPGALVRLPKVFLMTAQIEETALKRPISVARTRTGVSVRKTVAPFALRCGAILIDYILLVSVIVISSLVSRSFGGVAQAAGDPTDILGLIIAALVAILNFGILPGLRGWTIGKWATGLRIEGAHGQPFGIGMSLVRHFLGYPLSILTLGLGFLLAILNRRGRTLHDLLAGTVVVRDEIAFDSD
jgi:uncharacterized RDD family membrane protein YckC